MMKTTGMRMSARLALMQWSGCQEALLFELPPAATGADTPGTPRQHLVMPGDGSADVNASTMVRARLLRALRRALSRLSAAAPVAAVDAARAPPDLPLLPAHPAGPD